MPPSRKHLVEFDMNAKPHFAAVGFAAGTRILTVGSPKRIEDFKEEDMLLTQPDDEVNEKPEGPEFRWWEWN